MRKLILVLLLVALLLSACRFAVVESDSVTIAAPTAEPGAEAGTP